MAPTPAKRLGTAQAVVSVMRKPLVEGDFPRLSAAHRNNAVFSAINSPANKGKHNSGNYRKARQLQEHSNPQKR